MVKSRARKHKGGRSKSKRCWSGGAAPLDDTSMNAPGNQNLAQGRQYLNEHVNQHGGAAVSLASAAPVGDTGMLDDSLRATARIGVLDQSMQAIQGMKDQAGGSRRRRKNMTGGKRRKLMYGGKRTRKNCMRGGKMCKSCGKSCMRGGKPCMRGGAPSVEALQGLQAAMAAAGKDPSPAASTAVESAMAEVQKGTQAGGRRKGKRFTHKNIMKALKKLMKKHRGGAHSLSNAADYGSPGMLLSPGAEARALAGMNPEWKLATDPTSFTPKM